MTKICNTCKEKTPLSEFYKSEGTKDNLRYDWKKCGHKIHKLWIKNNPKKRTEAREKQASTRLILWLKAKFEGTPCMDCSKVFPWCVMDFDHRPGEIKSFRISKLNTYKATPYRIAMVIKEIDKCDLVCSNCHRIRTYITRKAND